MGQHLACDLVDFWTLAPKHRFRANENTVLWTAAEVTLSLDRAIVLSHLGLQLYTQPQSAGKVGCSNIGHAPILLLVRQGNVVTRHKLEAGVPLSRARTTSPTTNNKGQSQKRSIRRSPQQQPRPQRPQKFSGSRKQTSAHEQREREREEASGNTQCSLDAVSPRRMEWWSRYECWCGAAHFVMDPCRQSEMR